MTAACNDARCPVHLRGVEATSERVASDKQNELGKGWQSGKGEHVPGKRDGTCRTTDTEMALPGRGSDCDSAPE